MSRRELEQARTLLPGEDASRLLLLGGGSDGKRSWSSAGRSSVPAEEHHEQ